MPRFLLAALLLFPSLSFAQNAATLIADTVSVEQEGQLIATGNIEVFFEGSRLTANQVIYDQSTDTLEITGPIFIEAPDGTILTATRATLDPRIENGILLGARIVLDQQLQLAANQIDRRDGRYSQLYKSAATSCNVCNNRPPLWEIWAERVIHDQKEQQLYFRNATFRVRGVPLLWLPAMRLPDPNAERATGLLIPEQRNTTQLGFGVKLPYFITLGDHRDVTVTPYLSPETTTFELRYRQAFTNGFLEMNGAISDDTIEQGSRSYLFADATFDLRNDYQLKMDVETASDDAYLLDYGYADKDRLDSAIELLQVQDASLFQTRFSYYQTLRDDEENASLPPIVADLSYTGVTNPAFGGTLTYVGDFDVAYRYSDSDGDRGRDVFRTGLLGEWYDDRMLAYGIVAQFEAGARTDVYIIGDDSAYNDADLRFSPSAGVTLRWPFAQRTANGSTNLLEPAVQVGWAETYGGTPPNEDSTRTELDRANLLSVSRYAGEDRVEEGLQLAAGLVWSRYGAAGYTSSLSFGRVLRDEPSTDFTATSGLDGRQSDWLLSTQFTAPGGFLLDARSLWDDDIGLRTADSRLNWENDRIALGANYIWQSADSDEGRDETVSEWSFDGSFVLSRAWTMELDGRYNVIEDEPVRGGIGLQWQNECVTIDVSASRRFTSSSTVAASTTFGLSASIGGFSAGRAMDGASTSCRN